MLSVNIEFRRIGMSYVRCESISVVTPTHAAASRSGSFKPVVNYILNIVLEKIKFLLTAQCGGSNFEIKYLQYKTLGRVGS